MLETPGQGGQGWSRHTLAAAHSWEAVPAPSSRRAVPLPFGDSLLLGGCNVLPGLCKRSAKSQLTASSISYQERISNVALSMQENCVFPSDFTSKPSKTELSLECQSGGEPFKKQWTKEAQGSHSHWHLVTAEDDNRPSGLSISQPCLLP